MPKGGSSAADAFSALAREKKKDWLFIYPSVFH